MSRVYYESDFHWTDLVDGLDDDSRILFQNHSQQTLSVLKEKNSDEEDYAEGGKTDENNYGDGVEAWEWINDMKGDIISTTI